MSHEQLDVILDDGANFAIDLLEKNGNFIPFGITIDGNNVINHVQVGDIGVIENSEECINLIKSYISNLMRDGTVAACGVVSEVKFDIPINNLYFEGIRIEMDRRFDDPLTCYLPFRVVSGILEVGNVQAEKGTRFA